MHCIDHISVREDYERAFCLDRSAEMRVWSEFDTRANYVTSKDNVQFRI